MTRQPATLDAFGRLHGMTAAYLHPEDIELDGEWRARFGQPLPILGCADLVRRLLDDDAARRAPVEVMSFAPAE